MQTSSMTACAEGRTLIVGGWGMNRTLAACSVAFAAFALVPVHAGARPVVVVTVASDVQHVVIRTADARVVSVPRGEFVGGGRWRLAEVRGAEAIFEAKARYRGARVEMRAVAGQVIDFGAAGSGEAVPL